jgi:hypothetical protein
VLNVIVTKDFQDGDWLGIDTSGFIQLSAGVQVGSTVSVNATNVGTMWGAGGPKIEFAFKQNATPSAEGHADEAPQAPQDDVLEGQGRA